jgi:hypothetical protein
MRNEFGETLLKEPFLTLPSYEGRLLALTLRLGVLRAMLFEATGGAGLQVRGAPVLSSSTMTTIQTPI